jgi:hypothetical protein
MSKATFFVILFLAVFLGVFFYETLQEYPKVDIMFLQLAPDSFLDIKVKIRGFVKYHGRLNVDEFAGDFYLIPMLSSSSAPGHFRLMVMLNGFLPPEGSYIEISGAIKIHRTVWVWYYLEAYSWSYSTTGIEVISDTATLSVILALLLLLFALGKLMFSVLMYKRLKKALTSENYGFEYD